MRLNLFAIACVLATSNALAIADISEPQDKPTSDSLTLREAHAPLEVRTSITTSAGAIGAGASVISSLAALTAYLAAHVKGQSDANSCSIVSGSANGANWQFQATTSGANCDTTSETKTIENAVEKQLNWMKNNRVDVACFRMKHGSGTWTGNLRISLDGKEIASTGQCNNAKYVQI